MSYFLDCLPLLVLCMSECRWGHSFPGGGGVAPGSCPFFSLIYYYTDPLIPSLQVYFYFIHGALCPSISDTPLTSIPVHFRACRY